jgi:hypothetical protein
MVSQLIKGTDESDFHIKKSTQIATKIIGKINGLTSTTICALWDARKEKLEAKENDKKPSLRQTHIDHARTLEQRNLLTGPGGTGLMKMDAFLTLPKQHQINKVQNALRKLNGITDASTVVSHLPVAGHRVRTYFLDPRTNHCQKEEAITCISGYTGHTDTPYEIINMHGMQSKEVALQDLTFRTAAPGQCTDEENHLLNEHCSKIFVPDKVAWVKQSKRAFFSGGIKEVYLILPPSTATE